MSPLLVINEHAVCAPTPPPIPEEEEADEGDVDLLSLLSAAHSNIQPVGEVFRREAAGR